MSKSREQIITAIDLGSDKCATLIAKIKDDGNLEVLGFSAIPSSGMKRSVIVDLEKVLSTVNQSLDAAERMAGLDVKSVVMSISGTHIKYKNSRGVVAVASPDQEIVEADVRRVIEAARAISLPADREIIHVIPKDFKVDSQEGVKDPVGMTGIRLESEAHIITGLSTSLRNFEKCINDLGLKVDAFVFSALASAEIALTETEKELGVVLVDIGAGTTSICAYVEGSLEFSAVIPIGARHITQDIALGARISMEDAEKLKIYLTDDDLIRLKPNPGESKVEYGRRKKKLDLIDPDKVGIDNRDPISRKFVVNAVMEPRIKEVFSMVMEELDKADLLAENKVPAGLVVTGGGALTVNLIDVAKHLTKLSVRVAEPSPIQGLTEDVKQPNFAVGVGLLAYAKRQGNVSESKGGEFSLKEIFPEGFLQKFGAKIGALFKKILP